MIGRRAASDPADGVADGVAAAGGRTEGTAAADGAEICCGAGGVMVPAVDPNAGGANDAPPLCAAMDGAAGVIGARGAAGVGTDVTAGVCGAATAGCEIGVGTRCATAAIAGALARAGAGIAGELSDGVANADCTTPADAGVTITGNVPPLIAMIPPHTEQRARTPLAGTLAGSTRKTDRQSGQDTVIVHHPT